MSVPLRLGYVPLLDAAPLIIAEALGFAEEEGLTLDLHTAPSWASLRDMLAVGQVDAAQMLAPVPVAMALGLGRGTVRFEALCVLNLNGNVIGISNALAAKMAGAGYGFDFRDAAAAGWALLAAAPSLRIGVPYAFSMHRELLLYWLAASGAQAAQLDIRTVPPPRMAEALSAGEIDLFCVGEPWGSVAVENGSGTLLLPTSALWARAPEKVLAARLGWAEAEPALAGRLLRAVWRAGRWLSRPENHIIAAEMLTAQGRIVVSADLVERALTGRIVTAPDGREHLTPQLIEFFEGAAGFPWRSQAAWIGASLAGRHGLDVVEASASAADVFRSDLYRLHLRPAGAILPGASEKLEGALAQATAVPAERGQLILPADRFFDARIFDLAAPAR
ncbi:MAG: CmpA/NrtA family ABC transporter substrate-binding protein [Cypionkella sp.]|uniref:CmpA/NrtA family ABC transporter substrate-binding protein n=1 Tax=Cypionkella sp. TaxID=2811411 RepID=UPI002ABA0997|nr:CmpA/NrtA family ABC transporter substrate-binding protein [Cypionkella sp.]MDZ4310873.1 CmpA/NrtA family ABC transporter substrate-binding protein [Cypionkella sp.]